MRKLLLLIVVVTIAFSFTAPPKPAPSFKVYIDIRPFKPSTKMAPGGWEGCSQVNWGQPWSSCPTNLSTAASAEVNNAYAQGYNCVCREERQETVMSGGDFIGYVYCVKVTKTVTEACPCIGAY